MKILKNILLIILFVSYFFHTFASDKILLWDYKKYDGVDFNGVADVSTSNSKLATIINDKVNKKLYLDIVDKTNNFNIDIFFNYKGETRKFTYKYDPKFKENLDILNKIKIKRLQKRPLSCELSVTADILTYIKGYKITEDKVFEKIDNTYLDKLPYTYENRLFWGNPNKGFVGYMDYYGDNNLIKPTQRGLTGYGVYEKPISEVYDLYGVKNDIITKDNHNDSFTANSHLTFLLKNVAKGNMVQLWGDWCTREEYDDGTIDKMQINQEKVNQKIYAKNYCPTTLNDRKVEWYYIEDYKIKKHTGLIGEHAFYLLGYEGGVTNPTKIIVWDSDTGYHKYDTIEWMRKWSLMDYKSIVIHKP
ncbi:MAG: hypothetical protein WC850_00110 [Candidatus Gracilibacteria bacterium]